MIKGRLAIQTPSIFAIIFIACQKLTRLEEGMSVLSRIKQGMFFGLMLVLFASLSPVAGAAAVQPTEPAASVVLDAEPLVTIETDAGPLVTADANVRRRVIDFTKGEHLVQPRVQRPSLVYCVPQREPIGCIKYEPTLSWTINGCDAGAFVLDITYVNLMRREVPVETTNDDFTDTAFVPAATSTGPGVYLLQFRLVPSQLQLVTGHWGDVIFSREALRTEVPLCP